MVIHMDNIKDFFNEYSLGMVCNISILTGGLMHKMYKVDTNNHSYAVKVLNNEVMNREGALNNFILSEKIARLAKDNGISSCPAILINNSPLTKYKDNYYMIFEYIDAYKKEYKDITLEDVSKIGKLTARIHLLKYNDLNIPVDEDNYEIYNWEEYLSNSQIQNKKYFDLYKNEYKKYSSLQRRAIERFKSIKIDNTICHRDMDLKNILWDKDNNPVIIDWESAGFSNPLVDLIEIGFSLSGVNDYEFDGIKFKTFISEYNKIIPIKNITKDDLYSTLVGKFEWLKYNLDRSLNLIMVNEDEARLGEDEVYKTIKDISFVIFIIDRFN